MALKGAEHVAVERDVPRQVYMLTGAPYTFTALNGIPIPVTTYLFNKVKGATGITPIRLKLVQSGIIITLPEASL